MIRLACATLAALALAFPCVASAVPGPPLRDEDYFEFSGEIVKRLDDSWSERGLKYRSGARSIDTIYNAAILTVLATAAAHGYDGPARDDERARTIVRRLVEGQPWWEAPAPPRFDKMFHTPGWTSNMDGDYVDMDKSIDPKVAEALQIAYRARDAIGLDADTAALVADRIRRVAYTEFFRFPKVRLNQINWPAELYGYNALVNQDPTLLRKDYREQMRRFVDGIRRPWTPGGSTNLGPTYRFHYQNNMAPDIARNLDSAEYANMTLHFVYFYDYAVSQGMEPLPREDVVLLRNWTQRVLYGYWTHAGFMNWETGWSYGRWMKAKAWAYSQQGLLAIATSPRFQRDPRMGAWAKYVFDRGLRYYERLGTRPPGHPFLPDAQLFGIGSQGEPAARMFWARMAANSARAVSAGLGRAKAATPPPFYAFDADVGRLAVSTPAYSTAIAAVDRGILPYGGIELARLMDGDGDPLSEIGGRPPASFGVVVRDRRGRELLATQRGIHVDPKRPPVILARSPRGRVAHVRALPSRPDAGPFRVLDAVAHRGDRRLRVTTRHHFTARSIVESWTITARHRHRRSATVLFPSQGATASVTARLRDGREVALAAEGVPQTAVALRDVAQFRIQSRYGAYLVRPLGPLPRGATATTIRVAAQRAATDPGPTLQITLARHGFKRVGLRARIVPLTN